MTEKKRLWLECHMKIKCTRNRLFSFSGLKYQSNLNEIDKSEQKSQVDSSSKVFEWPSKDEAHVDSEFNFNLICVYRIKLF